MTTYQTIAARHILETLSAVKTGVEKKTLFEIAEAGAAEPLTTCEQDEVWDILVDKAWIRTAKNAADKALAFITAAGSAAIEDLR